MSVSYTHLDVYKRQEDGYTGDEVCKTCGEIVTKGEVVKATGHHYKDGKCTDCGRCV